MRFLTAVQVRPIDPLRSLVSSSSVWAWVLRPFWILTTD
jgi:hypothetical protein